MYLLDACCIEGRITARPQRLRHQRKHWHTPAIERCPPQPAPLNDNAKLKQRSTTHFLGLVEEARPMRITAQFIEEPARSIPVHGDYEVVVLGGGPAGIAAAASAAAHGRKAILVER